MKYDGYQVGIVIKSLRIQRNLTKQANVSTFVKIILFPFLLHLKIASKSSTLRKH